MIDNVYILLRQPEQVFGEVVADQIYIILVTQSMIRPGNDHHVETLTGPDQCIGKPERGSRMHIVVHIPGDEHQSAGQS